MFYFNLKMSYSYAAAYSGSKSEHLTIEDNDRLLAGERIVNNTDNAFVALKTTEGHQDMTLYIVSTAAVHLGHCRHMAHDTSNMSASVMYAQCTYIRLHLTISRVRPFS